MQLLDKAIVQYYNEFKAYNNKHIHDISGTEAQEYCTLYANDFNNWKKENGF